MSGLSYNETKRMLDLVWPEVAEEIELWIKDLQDILEDCEDESSLRTIHQAQGSLRALRNVLVLPEQLLLTKLSNEEEANDGSDQEPS